MKKTLIFGLFFIASSPLYAVRPPMGGGANADASGNATGLACSDCVDGVDLADTITLDASLTVNSSTVTISSHVSIGGELTMSAGDKIYGNTTSQYLQLNSAAGVNLQFGTNDSMSITGNSIILKTNGTNVSTITDAQITFNTKIVGSTSTYGLNGSSVTLGSVASTVTVNAGFLDVTGIADFSISISSIAAAAAPQTLTCPAGLDRKSVV